MQFAKLIELAVDVFGNDPRTALEWMLTPNLALENIAPVDFVSSRPAGSASVENLLLRIRHGVLA